MTPAALGVREHSGWGVLVAITADDGRLEFLLRRRIPLLADALPREAYHAASSLPAGEGQELVNAAYENARDCARDALAAAMRDLAERGLTVRAAGCGVRPTPVRAPFARVMKSHALLHASEGDMYRDAVAEAAEGIGLAVSRAPWKEVWAQGAAEMGLASGALQERVAALRAAAGPPWGSDEKEATAVAWIALVRAQSPAR